MGAAISPWQTVVQFTTTGVAEPGETAIEADFVEAETYCGRLDDAVVVSAGTTMRNATCTMGTFVGAASGADATGSGALPPGPEQAVARTDPAIAKRRT